MGYLATATTSELGTALNPLQVKGAWRTGAGFTDDSNDAEGGLWLQPGDYICIADNVSTDKLWFRKVSSVDRTSYSDGYAKVVLNAALPTTLVANSPIYLASIGDTMTSGSGDPTDGVALDDGNAELSDSNAGLLGMANALFDHTYLSKINHTATGGSDSYWKSVIKDASHAGGTKGTAAALTFERIDGLLLEMNQQFYVRPDLMVMNPGMWHEFISLSESNHSFFNQSQLPSGHKPGTKPLYSTANATTGQGDLKVLVDPYCPHGRIITCDTSEMGYATAQAMGEAKEDGSFLRHTGSSYDEFHGWLRWAGQFIAHSPSAIGLLQDVTQDIKAL